jgi:hypothetical protein
MPASQFNRRARLRLYRDRRDDWLNRTVSTRLDARLPLRVVATADSPGCALGHLSVPSREARSVDKPTHGCSGCN